jgi:hypothetical protein
VIGCALVAATGAAGAEEHGKKKEGRLPVSYTERPLTMPRLILNPELELAVDRIDLLLGVGTFIGLGVGARFGILDDLDAYAVVAPLEFGPFGGGAMPGESKAHYGNPTIGATYRFLRGRFELGATLGVTIVHELFYDVTAVPVPADSAGVILEPGGVFKLHILKEASLEGGLYIPIEIGNNGAGAGLRVPLAFAYDIIEPFHVGVRTGVGVSGFAPQVAGGSVGANLYIPLGVFAGYAVAGKDGPILDIDPFFTWPALIYPSAEPVHATPAQTFHPADFTLGVSVGGFFYF